MVNGQELMDLLSLCGIGVSVSLDVQLSVNKNFIGCSFWVGCCRSDIGFSSYRIWIFFEIYLEFIATELFWTIKGYILTVNVGNNQSGPSFHIKIFICQEGEIAMVACGIKCFAHKARDGNTFDVL